MTSHRPLPADRAELFAQAEQTWRRYAGILDSWPEGELHGRGSSWSPRDEYAHHARWLDQSWAILRARVEGTPKPPGADEPYEALNERWQAEDRALALDEAKRRCEEARARLLDYVRDLPEERLDEEAMLIATDDPVWHLQAHIGFIVHAFLDDEAALWERTVAALDAAGDGPAHLEGPAWTVRDVWAHLARWMHRAADYVEAYLAGSALEPITDYDTVNARWQAEDAALALSAARERAHEARARVRGLMEGLPPERWDGRVYGVLGGNTNGHYLEHLGYMGVEV
jgi:hypothetical protein